MGAWSARLRSAGLAALGALGGMAMFFLAGAGSYSVGPVEASVEAGPSLSGKSILDLPPLGAVEASTHWIPLRIEITVDRVRVEDLESYVGSPLGTDRLLNEVHISAKRAAPWIALRAALLGLLGGLAVAGLLRPGWRRAIVPCVAGLLIPLVTLGSTVLAFDEEALQEPTLTGSLSAAPELLGPLEEIPQRIDDFRNELDAVGTTAFSVYRFLSELSPIPVDAIRILHISDLHLNPLGYDLAINVARSFDVRAVVDSGDTTAEGTAAETTFVQAANGFSVPYIWVRGNHDSSQTQAAIEALPKAHVLDADAIDIDGITFAGFGDPTFTPGHSVEMTSDEQEEVKGRFAKEVLAEVRALVTEPDVVLVHDPAVAELLAGQVPLVLAGHGHRFTKAERDGTIFLTVGSTGGAGLKSLSPASNAPRSVQVLYFSPTTHALLAVDRINVEGVVPRFTLNRLLFT